MIMASMRRGVVNVINAGNKHTEEAKNKGVNMKRAPSKRVMGGNKDRNLVKCTSCDCIRHVVANCYVIKPCPKCGGYGHTSADCWGRNLEQGGYRPRVMVSEV